MRRINLMDWAITIGILLAGVILPTALKITHVCAVKGELALPKR